MHMTDWLNRLMPVRDFIDAPGSLRQPRTLKLLQALPRSDLGASVERRRSRPAPGPTDRLLPRAPACVRDEQPDRLARSAARMGRCSRSNTTNNEPGSGYPAHAPFCTRRALHRAEGHQAACRGSVLGSRAPWAVSPTAYHPGLRVRRHDHVRRAGRRHRHRHLPEARWACSPGNGWSNNYDHYSEYNGRDFVTGTVGITSDVKDRDLHRAPHDDRGGHRGATMSRPDVRQDGDGQLANFVPTTVIPSRGPLAEQAAEGACPAIQPKEPASQVAKTQAPRMADGA